MTTTAIGISQIQLVMIPSTDQDRSIAFYEALGFEKRSDFPWGANYRWVELYPPGGTAGIALVPPGPGDPTGVATGMPSAAAVGWGVTTCSLNDPPHIRYSDGNRKIHTRSTKCQ